MDVSAFEAIYTKAIRRGGQSQSASVNAAWHSHVATAAGVTIHIRLIQIISRLLKICSHIMETKMWPIKLNRRATACVKHVLKCDGVMKHRLRKLVGFSLKIKNSTERLQALSRPSSQRQNQAWLRHRVMQHAYKILIRRTEKKRQLWISTHRRKDNIKTNYQSSKVWLCSGFNWLTIWTSIGCCGKGDEKSSSDGGKNYWAAERLLAWQEEICSMRSFGTTVMQFEL
jgi:hypothetical protein